MFDLRECICNTHWAECFHRDRIEMPLANPIITEQEKVIHAPACKLIEPLDVVVNQPGERVWKFGRSEFPQYGEFFLESSDGYAIRFKNDAELVAIAKGYIQHVPLEKLPVAQPTSDPSGKETPSCCLCGGLADHKHTNGEHCCGVCCSNWGSLVYENHMHKWIDRICKYTVSLHQQLSDTTAQREGFKAACDLKLDEIASLRQQLTEERAEFKLLIDGMRDAWRIKDKLLTEAKEKISQLEDSYSIEVGLHNKTLGKAIVLTKEREELKTTLGNALQNCIRLLVRLKDGQVSCKVGNYTSKQELEGSIKTAITLAELALGIKEQPFGIEEKPPSELTNKELCDRFASNYMIHSNPSIYKDCKAGYDELLSRLERQNNGAQ